jgi:HlyD family secretion protein
MAKKKSRKRIIILVVVLVVVAVLVFGYIGMRERAAQSGKTTYDTVSVQKGDIQVRVKGSGSVQPLKDNTVYAAAAGTVDTVIPEDGDVVKADEVIATFKSDDLESQRDSLKTQIRDADAAIASLRSMSGDDYIRALSDGTVKAVYAKKGDSVDAVMDKYGALAIISPDNVMKVVILYKDGISQGQAVKVMSNGKSVSGKVAEIDAVKDKITVNFKYNRFKAGNSASISTDGGAALGEGTIETANPVYIIGRGGNVSKVYKSAGRDVSRGDKMFHLSGDILSSQLYSKIDERADLQDQLDTVEEDLGSLVVKAGTDGVISGLSLSKDQAVQAGTKLFTVKSNENVKVDVDIDELDIANIKIGQEAAVTFEALRDKEFTAKVQKINPVGTSQNNVTHFTVTLELDKAEGVMLGMSADVEIISRQAEGALYVPIEAIQIINGEKYVVMAQDIKKDYNSVDAARKVTTGITDGVNIEITSGLSEGEQVAVPQVKSLSLQEQQMQMFGNRMNGGSKTSAGASSGSPAASE